MLRLAFDFIIAWRETRTRPNAYHFSVKPFVDKSVQRTLGIKISRKKKK